MALDLTGITNEREFYTDHYIDSVLEDDLRPVFARWTAGSDSPVDAVRRCGATWPAMHAELEGLTDPGARLDCQRAWLRTLLDALGYAWQPGVRETEDGIAIPIAGEITRADGSPELWLIEALDATNELSDPLSLPVLREQLPPADDLKWTGDATLEDVLTEQVFASEEPPRWVLLFHAGQLILIDRTKWADRRLLRFHFDQIFTSNDASHLLPALAGAESICPRDGNNLLDRLDEGSHKHAAKVSEDLKYSARECIERIGNEALYYLGDVLKEKVHGVLAPEDLSRECLRYLYRLLFLFYVEARPALGYAPMDSEEYRTGYSLESLRELALAPLDTERSRNGYFIDASIKTLFKLIYSGFAPQEQMTMAAAATGPGGHSLVHTFEMKPLEGDLFDDARTPTLRRVRLRNHVLQQVLESLGYSRKGSALGRGRISYAQLGINQLGAVYEGLLSYTGFFAKTDLYEVKKAETKEVNLLDQAWFVSKEDLSQYESAEIVYDDETGHAKVYPLGTFIYRLNGRSRQKSASYYTPEVLTKCVVKYALKELLEGKTADQILKLTVCEPALGSGAFLNEAINQLADAYLDRKQAELKRRIPEGDLEQERQKVKAFLADNRVFGVDQNPVAVELAEISLWLNTIYQGHTIPWFGGQLATGNSLIGARRQVFRRGQLTDKARPWLESVPERIPAADARPPDGVYHFLVPDKDMSNYGDKVVKAMCPKEMKRISDWRKEFRERFDAEEAGTLVRLSEAVDRLWTRHTDDLRNARAQTAHDFAVWGQPAHDERGHKLTTRERDAIFRKAIHPDQGPSTAYQRLRFVMDYWCALWFWPIEKADLLPTRHEFLLEVGSVLEGMVRASESIRRTQGEMFAPEQMSMTVADEYGLVDVKDFCDGSDRLTLVREIAGKHRFLHWELEFADVFADARGFDLILGNPPWIKVEWNEGAVMGDVQPLYVLRDFDAPKMATLRDAAMAKYPGLRSLYLEEYTEFEGTQAFLNALQSYPLLLGSQSNTYKCFVTRATELARVSAYVHDDGMFNDPKAGALREYLYPRLRYWFQFENEVPLFEGLNDHGRMRFEVSVLGPPGTVGFAALADVFWPTTIDKSFAHDGSGPPVEGRKTDQNQWSVAGHRDRIIVVDEPTLALFASLYDEPGTPSMRARLPVLRARELVAVLRKFAAHPKRLEQLGGQYATTEMWHETNAVKAGTIRRETRFPSSAAEWILSGPHIYVGNPMAKTPRAECTSNGAYDVLDLLTLGDGYLPRTNYVPDCAASVYKDRIPGVPWDAKKKISDYYRLAFRGMLQQANEHSLIGAIIPRGAAHIHGIQTTAFADTRTLGLSTAISTSIIADFFLKTTGRSNLHYAWLQLPLLRGSPALLARVLLLNCLSSHYADLWIDCWDTAFTAQRWYEDDRRLPNTRFSSLSAQWSWQTPLRTDFERNQARTEIDVLVAAELGLTVDELCTIYRIQFPVLMQYQRNTWYDRNGRIVYLAGDTSYGLSTPEWKRNRRLDRIDRTFIDDTLPDGPRERTIVYEAPFDQCDREEGYRTVWAEFTRRQA
jgi:hypothetical protein